MTGLPARLGAVPRADGRCEFLVWAPLAKRVELQIVEPKPRLVPLAAAERGYFHAVVDDVGPGALYLYRLDGAAERPDPASRSQPRGVHGPSRVVAFGPPPRGRDLELRDAVFYELHVGAFSPEGTFDAVVPRLDDLAALGVTALELMPVAQFPGVRGWGYDGVYPFAVQDSYGGPDGLRRLVEACHARGLAVFLDVVYNHLGPEGNYLAAFGPYFADRYRTPWGWAMNFDGPGSDEVRRYFVENALQWIRDFGIDGLRLDAVHAIVDVSARPFLEELADEVRAEAERRGRKARLVAESDRNDPAFVLPASAGGMGLDAQWNDDFHHALHALLTGERQLYYGDFGKLADLAKAVAEGYVFAGERSEFRGRRHGRPTGALAYDRFVICAQNHDQVGNRSRGERLPALVDFERLKLAAAAVLLSPGLPLLFMGEEYGETAPFLYFADHSDPGLVEGVRKGRKEEYGEDPEIPDPYDAAALRRSTLRPELRGTPRGRALLGFHADLLRLRRELPCLRALDRRGTAAVALEADRVLLVHRSAPGSEALAVFRFAPSAGLLRLPARGGRWRKLVDSAAPERLGPGSALPERLDLEREASLELAPWSAALYVLEDAVGAPAPAAGA